MSAGPCLIAAVDLNGRAEGIIQRAARLARFGNLRLVVTHVVEHHTGFESDHVPFATPAQLRAALARDARAWLLGLMHHLEMPETEIVVAEGRVGEALAALAVEQRARTIVTGTLKWGAISKLAGLAADPRLRSLRCDVLHVGEEGAGGIGRRISALASRWLGGEHHNL